MTDKQRIEFLQNVMRSAFQRHNRSVVFQIILSPQGFNLIVADEVQSTHTNLRAAIDKAAVSRDRWIIEEVVRKLK